METSSSFAVSILGRSLTIQSGEDEAYVRELCDVLDPRVRQVRIAGDPLSTAVLAALRSADELRTLRREQTLLTSKIEALAKQLSSSLGDQDQGYTRI